MLLALSYGLVACLWGLALHRAAGTRVAAGARIWFLSNLARYVPGNVWSYVGAVELARREGVARRTTLAVMALTQVLSVGALLAGLPVLLAERARLGRPALLGAVVVAAGAVLAAVFRRQLLDLARRRMPGFDPAGLTRRRPRRRLVAGYAVYWAVTGLAFAALVASLYPLARPTRAAGRWPPTPPPTPPASSPSSPRPAWASARASWSPWPRSSRPARPWSSPSSPGSG